MSDPDSTPSPRASSPRQKNSCLLPFFIGLSLLLTGVGTLFYFLVAQPAMQAMQAMSPVNRLAEALKTITNTEVSVHGSSVTLARAEMRELAVVERKVESLIKYETQWLGSDKMIIVKGEFLVKAGFDLTEFEGFELEGEQVVGEWPEAKVLSVELLKSETFYAKNGVLNKLTDDDRDAVNNLLQKQAREDAEVRSDILESAKRVLETRLRDLGGGLYEISQK